MIKGKLYVSGGVGSAHDFRNGLYVYSPATNTWAEKAGMPTYNYGGVTGVIGEKLYVLTSCSDIEWCDDQLPAKGFYRYDPATNRWMSLPLPLERHLFGMAGVIGGKLYVVGGYDDDFNTSRTLEAYDPLTNQWATKTPLNNPRSEGQATAVGAKLYVISGFGRKPDGTEALIPTVTVYDPATNVWSTKAPLPSARAGVAAVRVVVNGQGRVEVVGGSSPNNWAYIP
jgi:N-acetylneuraminic acid mutarotase